MLYKQTSRGVFNKIGCARHSPNKFGSALACTIFAKRPKVNKQARKFSCKRVQSRTRTWAGVLQNAPTAERSRKFPRLLVHSFTKNKQLIYINDYRSPY